MTVMTNNLNVHWAAVRPLLTIRNEADYERVIGVLNELLDEVGTNELHPLYDLLDTLGTIVAAYEADHVTLPATSGTEVLAYLMAEHDLTQSDLSEIGSQGVISEILSGKREMNVRQIRLLAERFNVSPEVFI